MMLFDSKGKMGRISLALLLIVTILVTTGCPGVAPPPPPPYLFYERPAITSDGAGGIIVFYATHEGIGRWREWCRQRRFYVQRVDREGSFLWGEEGVLLEKGYSQGTCALEIVSDGYGGAILVWRWRAAGLRVSVARISPEGEILWKHQEFLDVRHRLAIVSDSLGGVIIGWPEPQYRHLRVQRIDSQGNLLWEEDGLTLSEEPLWMRLDCRIYDVVVSEDGVVIFVWVQEDGRVFAQKVSPEGEILWPEGGAEVVVVGELRTILGTQVVNDGMGGAIIAWTEELLCEDRRLLGWEILARRIDARGNLLWQEGGTPVFTGRMACPPTLHTISSGAGEAIIARQAAWPPHFLIYAQKIDSEGNLEWQEGGVRIYQFDVLARHFNPSMVGDNFRGAILVLSYRDRLKPQRVLKAQRVDTEGKLLWPGRGVAVTTIPPGEFSVFPDDQGGVFVAWVAHEYGPMRPYIQRINAEGKRMWGDEGIFLNP